MELTGSCGTKLIRAHAGQRFFTRSEVNNGNKEYARMPINKSQQKKSKDKHTKMKTGAIQLM